MTAILDGFTITAANNTDNNGGGMSNNEGDPTVTNCTFSGNAAMRGGDVQLRQQPTLTNCNFGNSTTQAVWNE